MGNVIYSVESNLAVFDEQEAFEAIQDLMEKEYRLGRGRGRGGKHFSWLNRAEPDEWECLDDAMSGWRFPPTRTDGIIDGVTFTGEKVGQEELMFDAMSPFAYGYVKLNTEYEKPIVYTL